MTTIACQMQTQQTTFMVSITQEVAIAHAQLTTQQDVVGKEILQVLVIAQMEAIQDVIGQSAIGMLLIIYVKISQSKASQAGDYRQLMN